MRRPRRARYQLYYWPGIQGRGEFIRLAFEAAGVDYLDWAQVPESEGGGVRALARVLAGAEGKHAPHFAPPILAAGAHVVSQTADILDWVAPALGLVPRATAQRRHALQLQLTLADLVSELHDVHHPIAASLYYEQQRAEARRRAGHLVGERLPKFLGYFERVLARGRRGRHLVGNALSYVDLSMFQILSGLRYAFPRAMARLEPDHPRLAELREHVAARPRIAAYLVSARRIAWNERDLFRHYPELDRAAAEPAPT
jgi:glutathione S-transferase